MGFVFPGNPFEHPNMLVPLVMFLWFPVVLYLFSRFPARKAVIVSFLVAWLFLPQAELVLPGIPDYNKMSATCYSILLATLIYDVGRFQTFRLSLLDLPMAAWCLSPFIASMANDLGPYDGFAAVLDQTMRWGVPYFLGRIYLNNLEGLRQLAMGIFVGGLTYVPLCLFEIRLSPQLHKYLYGGFPHSFGQTIRDGGYRPNVFMETGLMVGAFMMAATLIGIWFWQIGMVKKIWNIPMPWLMWPLIFTFALLKSYGAYTLLIVGVGVMLIAKQFRTAIPLFMIIVGIGVYLYVNAATSTYSSDQLVATLSDIFPPDRIQSYVFRLNNEEMLVDRARQHFWFGWGGWGRSRQVIDALGQHTEAVQDSLWVIAFGEHGMFGLISCFMAMLVPITSLFSVRYPAPVWFNRKAAGAAVLGVVVVLYAVDCILNAMINPIYILALGGLSSIAVKRSELLKPMRRAVQRRVRASYDAPASETSAS